MNFFNECNHINEFGFSCYLEKPKGIDINSIENHISACSECLDEYQIWKSFLDSHKYTTTNETKWTKYFKYIAGIIFIFSSFFFATDLNSNYDLNEDLEPMVGDIFNNASPTSL